MSAAKYDLNLEQGVTFRLQVTVKTGSPAVVVNLTGYEARMQVRTTVSAVSTLLSLTSSPAAGLTLGGALGTIDILITAEQTTALSATKGVYDLEIVSPSGDVTRLLKGNVVFDAEVTR